MKSFNAAYVSYRIPVPCWVSEIEFNHLLSMIRELRPAEEYALFTNDNHTPPPWEVMAPRLALLKPRIAALRALGVRVGVNHLCTLGHTEENLAYAATGGRPFLYADGVECRGSVCPNDPQWRESYVKRCYEAIAQAGPDFIWIDDDVRLCGHRNPWHVGCFCPECLAEVREELGFDGTLAELEAFFEVADPVERRRRRSAMLQRNCRLMEDLAGFIERTVHAVNPAIVLGQMDGLFGWNGLDYPGHAAALAGPEHRPVWWRPGGGFYRDACPDDILTKGNALGREAAFLPPSVEVIEAELESFNYQLLHKSRHFTALEPQVYCAAGMTGVAYNIFGDPAWEEFVHYRPLVAQLKAVTPFLDRLVRDNGRRAPVGIFDGMTPEYFLANNFGKAPWLGMPRGNDPGLHQGDLLKLGLPPAFTPADARVTALGGNLVHALRPEQIRALLSRGVYLDGAALLALHELGYGAYTGFTVRDIIREDAIEELTAHRLNGAAAGQVRNVRQSFWAEDAYVLEPAPGAEILGRLIDYAGRELAPCASGCFENALGGRVVVAGYAAWQNIFYQSKTAQLKRLFRYLSGDTLPAWVASYHRAALWARESAGQTDTVEVLNLSMDPACTVEVMVRCTTDRAQWFEADGRLTPLTAVGRDGAYGRFVLPDLAPWTLGHLKLG